jgi:hypothetical protein
MGSNSNSLTSSASPGPLSETWPQIISSPTWAVEIVISAPEPLRQLLPSIARLVRQDLSGARHRDAGVEVQVGETFGETIADQNPRNIARERGRRVDRQSRRPRRCVDSGRSRIATGLDRWVSSRVKVHVGAVRVCAGTSIFPECFRAFSVVRNAEPRKAGRSSHFREPNRSGAAPNARQRDHGDCALARPRG